MSVVLACDLGGTSMRAALVDRDGNVLVERGETVPVTTEGIGRSEVDANDWWQALIRPAAYIFGASPCFRRRARLCFRVVDIAEHR